MLKYMQIAVQLAQLCSAPIALGAEAVELWSRAAQDLSPDADHTEIARWILERSGLPRSANS
jgi:3-hydroxyisobutyrate dehydrogenase